MGVRESVCTVKEPLAHMSLRLPERDEPSEAGFPSPEAHFANFAKKIMKHGYRDIDRQRQRGGSGSGPGGRKTRVRRARKELARQRTA